MPGAAGIGTLTIAVGEISKIDHWYQTILGRQPQPVADDALEMRGLREQACDTARAMAALVQDAIDSDAADRP